MLVKQAVEQVIEPLPPLSEADKSVALILGDGEASAIDSSTAKRPFSVIFGFTYSAQCNLQPSTISLILLAL